MMESKFRISVKAPMFTLEQGAESECWNRFSRRFDIVIIGAGLKMVEKGVTKSRIAKAGGQNGIYWDEHI